jgi:hypothetical protein
MPSLSASQSKAAFSLAFPASMLTDPTTIGFSSLLVLLLVLILRGASGLPYRSHCSFFLAYPMVTMVWLTLAQCAYLPRLFALGHALVAPIHSAHYGQRCMQSCMSLQKCSVSRTLCYSALPGHYNSYLVSFSELSCLD